MENDVIKSNADLVAVLTTFLTFVNVSATIIYVIFTIRIAAFTKRATEISQEATKISQNAVQISKKQLERVAELEENRVRPYVLFNIISNEKHMTLASIKNYGLTAAYDISVSITPSLSRAYIQQDKASVITSQTFSILPPNYELTDALGFSPDFYKEYKELIFSGIVSYKNAAQQKAHLKKRL